jgi:hypothetical protein
MVGSGLANLRVRLLSAKPYADRLFAYAELGRLSEAAARSALIGPAAAAGNDYDESTARQIVTESAGFPYFCGSTGARCGTSLRTHPLSELTSTEQD